MKTFLSVCFFVIFFSSCIVESKVKRTYLIENKTDHKIKIDFFLRPVSLRTPDLKLVRTVDLKEKDSSWKIDYEESKATGVDPFEVYEADSVQITFDDTKELSYAVGDTSNRNLLFNTPYKVEKDLYRYTFTEEDYLKAK